MSEGPGDDAFPKGRFDGFDLQSEVPFEFREGSTTLAFDLKDDVPLRKLLEFADATQGLCAFDGEIFRGRLILPNIYKVYSNRPDLIDASWVEPAALVPSCQFALFTVEAMSKEDVVAIKSVMLPLSKSCEEYKYEDMIAGLELL